MLGAIGRRTGRGGGGGGGGWGGGGSDDVCVCREAYLGESELGRGGMYVRFECVCVGKRSWE